MVSRRTFWGGVIADFCMDNITSKWVWVCFHMTSGHPMCKEAWLRFLGVGNDRLLRCKRTYNGLDKRSLTCGGGFLVIFKIDSVNLNDSKHTIQAYPKAKSPNFFSHCLNCFSFSLAGLLRTCSPPSCQASFDQRVFYASLLVCSWMRYYIATWLA